jgi:hypothetical protein
MDKTTIGSLTGRQEYSAQENRGPKRHARSLERGAALALVGAVAMLFGGLLKGAATLAQQQEARPTGNFGLSAEDFARVKTLKEALEVVKQELIRNGKPEYAALLSEKRVRESIRTGIRSVEAHLDKMEQLNPGSKGHFSESAKPVFTQILEDAAWPPNCSFFGFYTLSSPVGAKSITYNGF